MAGAQQLLHGDCSLPHHVEIGKRREICDGIGSGCTCGDLTECEIVIVMDWGLVCDGGSSGSGGSGGSDGADDDDH